MSRTSFRVNPNSIVCLNVKERLARSRRHIWLIDSIGTWTHNHLVCKRTLNHLAKLAKWLSCAVSSYLYGGFDCILLLSGGCGFESRCYHSHLRYGACFEQGVSWYSGKTTEWVFTLELVRDMIITYSQMHRTDENSQHSLIIWLVLLNGWAFVYELSGCGFESRCCLMYTNADLKISLFDLLYIKMMPWKFRILNLNISRVNL